MNSLAFLRALFYELLVSLLLAQAFSFLLRVALEFSWNATFSFFLPLYLFSP